MSVHVEHSGARAAWRTRVARMASSRRSTLPWLACVETGLCAWPAATAIDHMQMLTDEVQERTRPVVGRDGCASPGRAVLSRRVVFRLCLRNGSCEPKRESVEMTDLLPDSVELRRLNDGAPQRRCARQVALNLAGLCFAAHTGIIAEKHLNRVIIPAADRKNCSRLIDTRFGRCVEEKPSPCINIRWALLDRCRELGLRRVDCAWKQTIQPKNVLCRCGAAVELALRSYSGAISHRVLRRCPGRVPPCRGWNLCSCNGAPLCTYITRVAHAECGAGGCARGARLLP